MTSLNFRTLAFHAFAAVALACVLMLAAGCANQAGGATTGGTTPQPTAGPTASFDLAPFKEMARTSVCADIANRLYLIDGKFMFWDVRGNCADASYAFILFGSTTDNQLCNQHDSIAGPAGGCNEASFEDMFHTITANLDQPDLGLGTEHTVEPIPF
jgi:hypothetical protein